MLHEHQNDESRRGFAAKKGRGIAGRVVAAIVSLVMLGSVSFTAGTALADTAQDSNAATVVADGTTGANAAAAGNRTAQATQLSNKAQKAQDAINALPDASADDFTVDANNVGELNDQIAKVNAKVNALSTDEVQKLDTTRADVLIQKVNKYSHDWAIYAAQMVAENAPSSTKLPDGVSWADVRSYIDANFTGSKVFADAVYNTIYASGQDYTNTSLYGGLTLHSAADVVTYFGAGNRSAKVFVTDALEDNAVLTGITLLNKLSTVEIENVGSYKSLGFLEDAYTLAAEGKKPYDTPQAPAIVVDSIGITVLPKNPYKLNLTRTVGTNLHNFQTTAYNRLPVAILRERGGKNTQINIDTTLTGRNAKVDLGSVASANGGVSEDIHPTEVEPTFNEQPTSGISASGNTVTMSIPNDGADGAYEERIGFNALYRYFNNTVPTTTSLDYFYRADVTYLNTVKMEGDTTILSDLNFQKVDEGTKQPLKGAKFEVFDSTGVRAKYAKSVDNKGNIQWEETGTYTSDENGNITVKHLEAGVYYLKETEAPEGYELTSNDKIEVTVAPATMQVTKASATNGYGKTAEVYGQKVSVVADNFRDDWDWDSAWHDGNGNIRVQSGKETVDAGNGVYIKNGGNSVTLNDASVTGDGVQLLSGAPTYTMTDSDGTKGTFKTLQDAQDAINKLIAEKKLDADNAVITVNTGKRVYYAPGKNASETQVTNKKLPVYIQPSVTKLLSGDAVLGKDESKTFTFRLSGEGVDQTASVELKKTDKDASSRGTATFDMLKYDADALGMDANGQPVTDKTFTYKITEESGNDPDVTYNLDGVYYEMAVHVTALDGTTSDGYGYRAEVTVTKVATDKDGVEHKTQVFNRAFTSKETNGNSTDDKGNVTYQSKPGQVKTEDFKFENVLKPSFEFVKTDGDDYKFLLQGATFSLFRCNSENCPEGLVDWRNGSNVGPDKAWSMFATQTSGTNGKIEFSGLADGEYRLVETKAPGGYTLPAGQWRVIVKDGSIERPEAIKDKDGNLPPAFHKDDKNGGLLGLGNNKHMSVPSTGGRGLIVFASLGGALLLAGVTVFSAEARRKANLQ